MLDIPVCIVQGKCSTWTLNEGKVEISKKTDEIAREGMFMKCYRSEDEFQCQVNLEGIVPDVKKI